MTEKNYPLFVFPAKAGVQVFKPWRRVRVWIIMRQLKIFFGASESNGEAMEVIRND
jgi:hypothetical protein